MALSIFGTIFAVILGIFVIRKYREQKWGMCESKRSLKNKTVIVTGANSGLGKETALELAKRGARVILACRDTTKAYKTLIDIRSQSRDGILRFLHLDLSSFESIRKFAEEFLRSEDRLDILINNAGVFQCPFTRTEDGYEMQFGVNHLGHFLLTKLLLEKLRASSPSRVIIVSSELYKKGCIDFENINSEVHYSKSLAYKNSKLANVLFANELAKRVHGTGVSVCTVSPGMVYTNLGRHIPINWFKMILMAPFALFFIRTPHQGCQTILHCAITEDIENENGCYYRNYKKEPLESIAQDEIVAKKLWNLSEYFTREHTS